ncbi:hypothetical protein EOL96_07355 [Candidatus Saccharibacteria bacterium]|nr:hypothetical protein [Candidatus Saccharibacteria bacterium]
MRKKVLILLLVVGVMGALLSPLFFNRPIQDTPSTSEISDTAINEGYGCERMTADYRQTDPLCTNLEYARSLAEQGITFGSDIAGAPNAKNDTIFVLLTQDGQAQPIKNTAVTVSEQEDFVCIQAPCTPTKRVVVEGTTDDLGVLTLPDSFTAPTDPLVDLVVSVPGYEPVMVETYRGGLGQYVVLIR